MKKLLKSIILIFIFLSCNSMSQNASTQSLVATNADFETLIHHWTGNLKYLNYGDDKSLVTIPCTLETTYKRGALHITIVFDEMKNGKKMTNDEKFRITKDGKYFMMGNEKWEISSNKKTSDQIQIIANKRGKDNDRPSDLRITLTIEKGKSISWKKDVKYDGTDNFFNRNQFSFNL